MFNLDGMLAEYIDVKAAAAAAAKREKELKALLLEYAAGRTFFETDSYAVTIKTTTSERLDTATLYKDFPDIKKTYGRPSTSYAILPAVRQQEKQTA